ncbi:MAG: hypothetical protein ACSLEL_05035 [Candidatus Malihini olakiniferum]
MTNEDCGPRLHPVSVSVYAGHLVHVVGVAQKIRENHIVIPYCRVLDGDECVELEGMIIADLSSKDFAFRRA